MANKKKPAVKRPSEIKKGSAKFINLDKEYIAPITKVEMNYDYIRYGADNNYPEVLTNLLSSSGINDISSALVLE
jgi:hypothetical protein